MNENAKEVLQQLAKVHPQWERKASANHVQEFINVISEREYGLLPTTATKLMTQRIHNMNRNDYLVFVNQLLEEIQSFQSNAKQLYKDKISALQQILQEPENYSKSKEQVEDIYQFFIKFQSFYPDMQYEGDELAKHLGIHVIVTSVNRKGDSYTITFGVPKTKNTPVICFQQNQGDRLAHYYLTKVQQQEIPNCIHGTGNCLFDSFGLALIELALLDSAENLPENVSQRRKQQIIAEQIWGSNTNNNNNKSKNTKNKKKKNNNKKMPANNDRKSNNAKTSSFNKQRLKFESDINNLLKARELSNALLKTDSITTTKELCKLGLCFKDISWDEENEGCIRNKHGYRNRYNKRSNKKNDEGAKLNIEYLALLSKINSTDQLGLLQNKKSDFKKDLKVLIEKLNFIFSVERHSLTKEQQLKAFVNKNGAAKTKAAIDEQDEPVQEKQTSHDKEITFLLSYATFYNDQACVVRISAILCDIKDLQLGSLDLSDKINRYHLGYLFCQIGESAKELSHYLKSEPEVTETHSKEQLQIFITFATLAKYRQAIKGKPFIVSSSTDYHLKQMKYFFNIVLDDFIAIILDLLPNNYDTYASDKFSAKLTNKYSSQFKRIALHLKFGLRFSEQRVSLAAQITQESKTISNIENEIQQASTPSTKQASVPAKTESIDQFFTSKMARSLKGMSKFYHDDIINQFPICDRPLLKFFRRHNGVTSPQLIVKEREKKVESITQQLKKFKKHIQKKFEEKCNVELNFENTDIMAALTNSYGSVNVTINDKSKNVAGNHSSLARKLTVHKNQLKKLQQEREKLNLYSHLNFKPKEEESTSESATAERTKFEKRVIAAIKEIEFLTVVHEQITKKKNTASAVRYSMAGKMGFGFIGQIYKELLKLANEAQEKANSEKTAEAIKMAEETYYIFEHSILANDMFEAMIIRHKTIMHNITDCNDALVHRFGKTKIAPWLQEFMHMSLLLSDTSQENRLSLKDARLKIDVKNLNGNNLSFYFQYQRIVALNRFMQSHKAIAEYDSIEIPENCLPELVVETYWQISKAYRDLNQFNECILLLQKARTAAKNIKDAKQRVRKEASLTCDLCTALYISDKIEEATSLLQQLDETALHDHDHIIAFHFLLATMEALKQHQLVAKSRLEFLFVTYCNTLQKKAPALLLSIVGQLCNLYTHTRDYNSLKHSLELYQHIVDNDFHKLYPNMGQSSQYYQLIFDRSFIFHEMNLAIAIEDPTERLNTLNTVYIKYFTSTDKRKNFVYLQQNDERLCFKLQLEILLNKRQQATATNLQLINAVPKPTIKISFQQKLKRATSLVVEMNTSAAIFRLTQVANMITMCDSIVHEEHMTNLNEDLCATLASAAATALSIDDKLAASTAEKSVLYGVLPKCISGFCSTVPEIHLSDTEHMHKVNYSIKELRKILRQELTSQRTTVISSLLMAQGDKRSLAKLRTMCKSALAAHIAAKNNPNPIYSGKI